MDVTPLIGRDSQVIQSYAGGVFKISNERYDHPVIVSVDKTVLWNIGAVDHVSDLCIDSFNPIIDIKDDVDVVLLGCGATMDFLSTALRAEIKKAGINVDVMGTGAACRTYNVLMAEGRRVVCALLPVRA